MMACSTMLCSLVRAHMSKPWRLVQLAPALALPRLQMAAFRKSTICSAPCGTTIAFAVQDLRKRAGSRQHYQEGADRHQRSDQLRVWWRIRRRQSDQVPARSFCNRCSSLKLQIRIHPNLPCRHDPCCDQIPAVPDQRRAQRFLKNACAAITRWNGRCALASTRVAFTSMVLWRITSPRLRV